MHCVEHWAQKIPNKHRPKVCSKHVGTLWETIKGIFWIWKFFDFFESFRRLDPPWNSGKKLFFPKKSPKTRLDTWERFGQFENFEIFSIFFWNLFYVSTSNFKSGKPNSNFLSPENWPHIFKSRKSEKPCMEHSAKKNSEKLPQSMFKTGLDTFENDFGHFWNFENFLIFFEIFQNPTLHGTRGNFSFGKKATKLVQNKFGQFWEQFCAFPHFWIFFDFFAKTFDDSMEHWAKKNFEKIAPKHVWTLGNDFGQVLNFEFFPAFSLKFF